jgi:hypothetical protein
MPYAHITNFKELLDIKHLYIGLKQMTNKI